MNTLQEFERTVLAARGVVEVPKKEQRNADANSKILSRLNVGYSGHADFADYPNAKDLALYIISAGLIGLAMGAVYALFEFIS